MALFSNFRLTTRSGEHSEDINHAHIVPLMYKLITSDGDTDDLCVGFDRDRGRRQQELTNNKTQKSKYHARFMPKDTFGFSQCQENGTSGLG